MLLGTNHSWTPCTRGEVQPNTMKDDETLHCFTEFSSITRRPTSDLAYLIIIIGLYPKLYLICSFLKGHWKSNNVVRIKSFRVFVTIIGNFSIASHYSSLPSDSLFADRLLVLF